MNDVSLIKVDAPFQFNDNVKPVALPPQGFDPEGRKETLPEVFKFHDQSGTKLETLF